MSSSQNQPPHRPNQPGPSPAEARAPTSARQWLERGHELRAKGHPEKAGEAYRRATAMQPDLLEGYLGLVATLEDLGNLGAVVALCQRILKIRRDVPDFHLHLGHALQKLGYPAEAATAFRDVLALRPDLAPVWNQLGMALMAERLVQPALDAYRRALELNPRLAEAWNNLGNAQLWVGNIAAAIEAFQSGLSLRPELAELHLNLGLALHQQGRSEAAIESFLEAERLSPTLDEAHLNEGIARLSLGDWRRGWPKYEYRWGGELASARRSFSPPAWDGTADLHGRTILLYAEQGLGDTIQFVRYVPLVGERGATVLLEVQPALRPLLAHLPGVQRVFARGEALPAFDSHAALLSLPGLFATEPATVPAEVPYLVAEPERAQHWREKFASSGGRLKVGIAWSGNPKNRDDHRRSVPLGMLRRGLAGVPAEFYALHKDLSETDRAELAQSPSWTALPADLSETAAIMSQLDLVISVDTSLCHLAGALGRPTWTMLCFAADWRWLKQRDDSPWYPTMRLFRQSRPGEWGDVLQAVRSALLERTELRR